MDVLEAMLMALVIMLAVIFVLFILFIAGSWLVMNFSWMVIAGIGAFVFIFLFLTYLILFLRKFS